MLPSEFEIRSRIKNEDFIVRDHRVHDIRIMPGVTFLDTVYRALKAKDFPLDEVVLQNVIFTEPIVTTKNYDREIRIKFKKDSDTWKVNASSAIVNRDKILDSRWNENFRCDLLLNKRPDLKHLDLESLKRELIEIVDMDKVYAYARGVDINHYTFMKGLGRVYKGDKYLLAEIHLSDLARQYLDYFYLHPAYLDSSTLVPVLFIRTFPSEKKPFIPLCIESFYAADSLKDVCYVYVQKQEVDAVSTDVLYNDIELYSSSGKLAAIFKRLAAKQIRSKDLITRLAKYESSSDDEIDARASAVAKATKNKKSESDDNISINVESKILSDEVQSNRNGELSLQHAIEVDLQGMIAEVQGKSSSEVSLSAGFYDQGLDSVKLLKLVQDLEDKLGEKLYPTLLFEYTNIRELAAYLEETHREKYQSFLGLKDQKTFRIEISDDSSEITRSQKKPEVVPGGEIAIIGLAGRYPKSPNLLTFWKNVSEGENCITEIPQEHWDFTPYFSRERSIRNKLCSKWGGFIDDADKFDPLFFRISPRDAELIDPQVRLMLESAWHTLEDAGYTPERLRDKIVGVYTGVMNDDYTWVAAENYINKGNYTSPGSYAHDLANRISYFMNFQGPSLTIETACSSSLTAIHMARKAIMSGECEIALAGGVNLSLHRSKYLMLSGLNILSIDGREKTFDEAADGYVPGEGVGMVLLKALSDAIKDGDHIYGVIKGSAINHSGTGSGQYIPNVKALTNVALEAIEQSGVSPERITYIETHGTGTVLGDPIEVRALANAFGAYTRKEQYCALVSKANIGHLESASGICSLTKILLSLEHGQISKCVNIKKINPLISLKNSPFYIPTATVKWTNNDESRVAAINSFGIGGSNCFMIIEEAPHEYIPVHDDNIEYPQLAVLSAKNEDRLRAYAKEMSEYLSRTTDNERRTADIAYTLQVGREAMEERLAMVVSSVDELVDKFKQYSEGKTDIENLYRGNVKKDKGKSDILLEGRAGKEFLNIIIEDKDFNKIAKLWTTGVDIDWKLLHSDRRPRRISLPTYPFAKERYWIPEAEGGRGIGQGEVLRLHPLIERNSSTLKEQLFSTQLTGKEFYLSDHVVGGHKVLPGVAYLEMARAAGDIAGENKVSKIKNIVWARPVTVTDKGQEISIGLYPNGSGVDYEVVSNGGDNERVVHSQGKLYYDVSQSQPQPQPLDIEAIKVRCSGSRGRVDCYKLFDGMGLKYGSGFQAIEELRYNGTEAIGRLRLPGSVSDNGKGYILHPSLMDGALQSVMGLIGESEGKSLYLPFAMGEVEILGALPEVCYSYVRVSGNGSGSSQVKKFDIDVTDELGRVLVRMRDFSVRELKSIPSSKLVSKTEEVETMYYKPEWERAEIRDQSSDSSTSASTNILVFDTHGAVKASPSTSLGAGSVIVVKSGTEFLELDDHTFEINPGQDGDYVQLIETLRGRNQLPSKIVHLWSQDRFDSDADAIKVGLNEGLYSIFYLTKALMAQKPKDKVQLLHIYSAHVLDSALSGFFKTLRLENPKFVYKIVEFRGQKSEFKKRLWDIAKDEFSREQDVEVRYEGGERYVRGLKIFDIDKEVSGGLPIKESGVYLITGGLGGLGLIFARYLAENYKAKLVLTGRSDLKPVNEAKVKELEDLGSEILYIKADVSKREEVDTLIKEAKVKFNTINGVIHSAGVIKDSFIIKKTAEEIDQVISPKVYGAVNLDESTKDENLDFFVMFSSIAGVMGNLGQCDYAYANAFMDGFANLREDLCAKDKRHGKTLSINWPLWAEGGMRVDEESEKLLKKMTGMSVLDTVEGLGAFLKGLRLESSQFVVVKGDVRKIGNVLGVESTELVSKVSDGGEVKVDESDLLGKIQRELLKAVSDILKVKEENVDPEEDLSEYGFDSITLTVFANKLNETYNLNLTPIAFFENPTIGSFAKFLHSEHKETIVKQYTQDFATANFIHNNLNHGIIEETKKSRSRFMQSELMEQEILNCEYAFAKSSNGNGIIENRVANKNYVNIYLVKILRLFLRTFWKIEIRGHENIPERGPFILCPNHESDLDGFLIPTCLPDAHMNRLRGFVAKKRFDKFITRKIFTCARGIPVSADSPESWSSAMETGENWLREGNHILIFPEGMRSRTGEINKFNKGAAHLALKTGTPIIPVYINGTYEIYPRHKRLPRIVSKGFKRYPINVTFGEPIFADSITSEIELTQYLEECVKGLGIQNAK